MTIRESIGSIGSIPRMKPFTEIHFVLQTLPPLPPLQQQDDHLLGHLLLQQQDHHRLLQQQDHHRLLVLQTPLSPPQKGVLGERG